MQTLKNKLYANSPYTLGTAEDNAYRNGIDATLEAVLNLLFDNYQN